MTFRLENSETRKFFDKETEGKTEGRGKGIGIGGESENKWNRSHPEKMHRFV
jgi:hypothetical protein